MSCLAHLVVVDIHGLERTVGECTNRKRQTYGRHSSWATSHIQGRPGRGGYRRRGGDWFQERRRRRMDAAKSTTVATTTDTHTTRTHSPDSRCITSLDMLFYAFLSRQPTSRRSLILSPPTLSPARSRIQIRPYQPHWPIPRSFVSCARSAPFFTLSIPSLPTHPSAARVFWSCLYITLTFCVSLSLLLFHLLLPFSSLVESRRVPPS
ncbi:hypothetical protein PYCCODRAFT_1101144 [Trametes coccinea BRFM310]|uniref:Uncharacterized protein n=1 Tax=Trametes coccinea (strain BRFM310) TaxID=1353009 RepID=A0A1Y2I9B5_TRAC3|nr:hypothetical protein PYCCODRAFT_1101144 [Trametes coccinea BRFM310]